MSIKEKKEYLNTYRLLLIKIARFQMFLIKFPERREKYNTLLKISKLQRDLIEDEINMVDSHILSEILSQKYMCGKSLEWIAEELNYSKRHVERLHILALEKFTPFTPSLF